MAWANYASVSLRDSTASSGTSEQDDAVTLPESVQSIWVVVDKTVEEAADNLLTVRIQAKIGTIWVDLPTQLLDTVATSTAADSVIGAKTPNIADADSTATFTYSAQITELPSNILRVASVSSGAGVPANTFSVTAYFVGNEF